MKKIIWFLIDVVAFVIGVAILIYHRAERQAGKIRNWLNSK